MVSENNQLNYVLFYNRAIEDIKPREVGPTDPPRDWVATLYHLGINQKQHLWAKTQAGMMVHLWGVQE